MKRTDEEWQKYLDYWKRIWQNNHEHQQEYVNRLEFVIEQLNKEIDDQCKTVIWNMKDEHRFYTMIIDKACYELHKLTVPAGCEDKNARECIGEIVRLLDRTTYHSKYNDYAYHRA